jgi:hypothetical protein
MRGETQTQTEHRLSLPSHSGLRVRTTGRCAPRLKRTGDCLISQISVSIWRRVARAVGFRILSATICIMKSTGSHAPLQRHRRILASLLLTRPSLQGAHTSITPLCNATDPGALRRRGIAKMMLYGLPPTRREGSATDCHDPGCSRGRRAAAGMMPAMGRRRRRAASRRCWRVDSAVAGFALRKTAGFLDGL